MEECAPESPLRNDYDYEELGENQQEPASDDGSDTESDALNTDCNENARERDTPEVVTDVDAEKSVSHLVKKETIVDDDADVKPAHSYIALIAMAILSNSSKKMILGDIYQYISDNFPYYRNKDKSWRNSIRHNLSLNECFIKAGRSENGKGNYWAIHPANLEDFANGDFRRRRARRRVRKSNALKYGVSAGYPYFRSFTPYTPYSSYLAYRADDLTRVFNGYPSSYQLPQVSVARKSFAIDDLMSTTPQYNQDALHKPEYSDSSAAVAVSNSYSGLTSPGHIYAGIYGSSSCGYSCLSSLAGYSSAERREKESWQDTLCKLQEQLRKTSHL